MLDRREREEESEEEGDGLAWNEQLSSDKFPCTIMSVPDCVMDSKETKSVCVMERERESGTLMNVVNEHSHSLKLNTSDLIALPSVTDMKESTSYSEERETGRVSLWYEE